MQRIVRLERARDVKPLAAPRAQAQGHEVAAEASGIYSEEAQFREELGLLFVKSACMRSLQVQPRSLFVGPRR